jgi:hypothetical protein
MMNRINKRLEDVKLSVGPLRLLSVLATVFTGNLLVAGKLFGGVAPISFGTVL